MAPQTCLNPLFGERIFTPLGMSETGFGVTANQKARFATNYFLTDDGDYVVAEESQTSPFLDDNKFQSGGGGLVSTLPDYAKFAQMMLDGGIYEGHRVLNEATVKTMMSDQMDPDDTFMMPWLGAATFWIDPENKAFGIIMLQYFGQEDPKLHDRFRALAYSQTKDKAAPNN